MKERKKIYCPQCGRKAFQYDGKTSMYLYAKCKTCKKMVCFYPDRDEVQIKPLPKRTTSSGMKFI